ncbi:MAG: hypothetical protein EOP11_05295 [Proteobacteria bacterium]|nr:MAG: hypothetical protein EOP11_05295 [Pseudomonadota bacterium]
MNGIEWIGWLSSFTLLLTVGVQLRKQWREQTAEGVSKWLFIGQVLAEVGFVVYSVLLENWVFAVTNFVLLVENLVGVFMVLRYRRKNKARERQA